MTYSCGPLHMNEQRQDNQLEPIYNSSVIEDIALKIFREQWTIVSGGERRSGWCVLTVRHDDDDAFTYTVLVYQKTYSSILFYVQIYLSRKISFSIDF